MNYKEKEFFIERVYECAAESSENLKEFIKEMRKQRRENAGLS